MPKTTRDVVVAELLLLLPAAAFMAALVLRQLGAAQDEPGRSAQSFVAWFAGLPVALGLWGLLIALPGAALTIGVATLLRTGVENAEHSPNGTAWVPRISASTVAVGAATLTAFCILAVVAVHVLAH